MTMEMDILLCYGVSIEELKRVYLENTEEIWRDGKRQKPKKENVKKEKSLCINIMKNR